MSWSNATRCQHVVKACTEIVHCPYDDGFDVWYNLGLPNRDALTNEIFRDELQVGVLCTSRQNFVADNDDSSSYNVVIHAPSCTSIYWVLSQRQFLIGPNYPELAAAET